MNTASVMDQIIDTLTFEVEAIPQDKEDIYRVPLKVKIKLRKNDKIKKLLQSVTAVPKMGHPKYASDKIQTNSSKQTLTSFEILMADDETMKKPLRKQKRVLYLFKKAGCFGTQIEDEDYMYSRGTSRDDNEKKFEPNITTSTNCYEKRNFTLVKNYGSYEAPNLTKGTPKHFLGKCKPGGCLDPPFSEDKYMYIPKIIETKLSGQNHAGMCKNEVESTKSLTKNDSVSENKRSPSSPIKISSMNVKKSNSIITYPSMLSTELNNKDNDKKNVKEKQNSQDYTVSNNSSLKFIDTYYISPKTIKLSKAKEDSNLLDQSIIKQSVEITPLQIENSVHGQKIETLKQEKAAIDSESSLSREMREKTESLLGKHFVASSKTTEPKFFTENYQTDYLNEGKYRKSIDQNSKNIGQSYIRDEFYSSESQILSPIKKNTSVVTTPDGNYLENTKKATQDPYPSDPFIIVASKDNKVKNNINDNINVQGNPELFDENNVVIDKLSTSNIMNTTNSLQQLTGKSGENYFFTTSENEIARQTNNNLLLKQTIDGSVPQEISTNISSNHIPNDHDIDFKNQEKERSQQFHEKQVIKVKSVTNTLTGSSINVISSSQPKNERESFFIKEAVQYLSKVEENDDKTNDLLKGSKSIENSGQLKKSIEIGNSKFNDTSILTGSTRDNNLRDNIDYFDIDLPSNKTENMVSVSRYTIDKDEDFKKIKLIKDDNFLSEILDNAPGIGDAFLQNTSESIFHATSAKRSSAIIKNLEQEDNLSESLISNSVNINKGIVAAESNDSYSHSFEENIQPSGKLLLENVTTAKENKDSNTDSLLDYNHLQIHSHRQDFENDNNSTEITSNIKKKSSNELNTSMKTKFKPTRDSVEQNDNNIRSLSETTLIDLYDISNNKHRLKEDERIVNLKTNQKEDLIHLNMAIKSFLTFENKTIIKTLNTSSCSENKPYHSENIQEFNTIMRPGGSPVIIPINENNNLSLQVVKAVNQANPNQSTTKKTPLTGHRLQKFAEDGIALSTKSYFDSNENNIKKYVGDRNKSCGNLQQALDSIYDKNLVPLHKIIKNLRDDVDGLAKKKTLVQNALDKNLEKTSKPASKHCACVQFLF